MRDGIGTACVAGLLIVALLEGEGADVNHAKVGVKLPGGRRLLVIGTRVSASNDP